METFAKALIAESDAREVNAVALVVKSYLSACELTTADSGRKCLAIFKSSVPDIVILGDLADMPGLTAIRMIRRHSGVPIIVVSHNKDEHSLVQAFEAGADSYMSKPLRRPFVKVTVRRGRPSV